MKINEKECDNIFRQSVGHFRPNFVQNCEFRFFVQNAKFRDFVRFSSKTNLLCPYTLIIQLQNYLHNLIREHWIQRMTFAAGINATHVQSQLGTHTHTQTHRR